MVEHRPHVVAVAHVDRAHRHRIEVVDAAGVDHLQPVELHQCTGRRRLRQPMVEPASEPRFEENVITRGLHTHTGHDESRRSANLSG